MPVTPINRHIPHQRNDSESASSGDVRYASGDRGTLATFAAAADFLTNGFEVVIQR